MMFKIDLLSMVTLVKFWWASSRRTSSYWGHTVQCHVLRSKTACGSNQSRFARSTEEESTQIAMIHILKVKAYFSIQIRHPAYRKVQLYNPLNRVFLNFSSDCSRLNAHTEGSLSSETRYRTRPTQHSSDWHENKLHTYWLLRQKCAILARTKTRVTESA